MALDSAESRDRSGQEPQPRTLRPHHPLFREWVTSESVSLRRHQMQLLSSTPHGLQ
jgi:hypothetical protein